MSQSLSRGDVLNYIPHTDPNIMVVIVYQGFISIPRYQALFNLDQQLLRDRYNVTYPVTPYPSFGAISKKMKGGDVG